MAIPKKRSNAENFDVVSADSPRLTDKTQLFLKKIISRKCFLLVSGVIILGSIFFVKFWEDIERTILLHKSTHTPFQALGVFFLAIGILCAVSPRVCNAAWWCLVHNVFYIDFRKNVLPWENSLAVGLSCFVFLAGCVHPHYLIKAVFVGQTLLSFWSDYLTAGHYSISHGLDRISAKLLFVYNCTVCCTRLHPAFVFSLGVAPLVCFSRAIHLGRVGDYHPYQFWFTMWHLAAGLCFGATMYYGCRVPYLETGEISIL